jgi:hypothetical protein
LARFLDPVCDDAIWKVLNLHAVASLREVSSRALRHGWDPGDLRQIGWTNGQDDGACEMAALGRHYGEELLVANGDAFDHAVVQILEAFVADHVRAEVVSLGNLVAVRTKERLGRPVVVVFISNVDCHSRVLPMEAWMIRKLSSQAGERARAWPGPFMPANLLGTSMPVPLLLLLGMLAHLLSNTVLHLDELRLTVLGISIPQERISVLGINVPQHVAAQVGDVVGLEQSPPSCHPLISGGVKNEHAKLGLVLLVRGAGCTGGGNLA